MTSVVLLLTTLPATAQPAGAQSVPDSVTRQNEAIERQLQERLREDQRKAREAAPFRVSPDIEQPVPIAVPEIGAACRDIRRVSITGTTRLAPAVRQQIEQEFSGRCLGVSDLEAILAKVTKSYIDGGFLTTRAYLPAQDLRSGILVIEVIEGTIENFQIDSARRKALLASGAFPVRPGDVLNLRDLEQGIDQINRLSSNSAELDIRPGSQPGQSVVVIRNPSRTPVSLFLTSDNLGSESTGKISGAATVIFDSLLGLNELIAITRRQSIPTSSVANAESNSLAVSAPWGYSTFSMDYSESKYVSPVTLASGATLLAEGNTTSQSIALNRVVFRDQTSRLSLSGKITTQDTKSFFAGQFLSVASRKLTYTDLAVSGFIAVPGGVINARAGFVQGLPILGGLDDPDNLPDDLPHARFRKLTLDLGFNRRLAIAGRPASWSTQLSGQYALDTLYGSQQLLIGGVSSVRGFQKNTLSGDIGSFVRNEFSLPYRLDVGGMAAAGRAYVGYDIGAVRGRPSGTPQGTLSGMTLGTTFQIKAASLDLFASRPLTYPSTMTREPTQFGLRLSLSL